MGKKYFLMFLLALSLLFFCFDINAQSGNLPVIRINTQYGVKIADRENYVNMTFRLTDPDNTANDVSKTDFTDGIRGRGNSTWWYPKKPYRIRFETKTSLFGLEKAKSWVLLAEYLDATLLKNNVAFELGNRFGIAYNHSYHYVEFYLNGVYQGLYGLTEHNQVNPGRIDIDELEGWLVALDYRLDEQPNFVTTNYNVPVIIKSPEFEPAHISNPAYNFVRNDMNQLSNLMAAADFPENGYRDLVDIQSLVAYVMVPVIIGYSDFENSGSLYLYKDKGGKICGGPLWDYDLTFGSGWGNTPEYTMQGNVDTKCRATEKPVPRLAFFNRLFQDPVFLVKWKELWNNKYSEIASMLSFIDSTANEISKAAEENFKIWWLNYPVNFHQQIGIMKSYYTTRINYLNGQYNKVEVLPTYKTFATPAPQTFSLVAYGDITDLSASLEKAELSGFEVRSTSVNATGNGGFLATISVSPKKSLPEASYTDYLILRGNNQEKSFEHKVLLYFYGATSNQHIELSKPKIVGYYNMLGAKLDSEPQTGIYIILYDTGEAKKYIK